MKLNKKILNYKIFFIIVLTFLLGISILFLFYQPAPVEAYCCGCNVKKDPDRGTCDIDTNNCNAQCPKPTDKPNIKPTDPPIGGGGGATPLPGESPQPTGGTCSYRWDTFVDGQEPGDCELTHLNLTFRP